MRCNNYFNLTVQDKVVGVVLRARKTWSQFLSPIAIKLI